MILSPSLTVRALTVALTVLGAASAARAQVVTCDLPPAFTTGSPDCGPASQNVPCKCSECLSWDPVATADWYEVTRCNAADGKCAVVGDTRMLNRAAWTDEAGVPHAAVLATRWCVPFDRDLPSAGALVDYAVKACDDRTTGTVCSTTYSNSVRYAGAPYACFANGVEIPCWRLAALPDRDGDGLADTVDSDDDADTTYDAFDNCPNTPNGLQRDSDGDGTGDACDASPLAWGANDLLETELP